MKKYLIGFTLLTCVFLALAAVTTGSDGTDVKKMEDRLHQTSGQERLELLVELTGHYLDRDAKKALTYGGEALELLRDFPNPKQQVTLYNNISHAHSILSNHEEAHKYVKLAQDLAEKTGDKKGYAYALENISRIYFNEGDYDLSLKYSSQALDSYEKLGNREGIAGVLKFKGTIYYKVADYPNAHESFLKAAKIYEKLGKKEKIASIYISIGAVNSERGQDENALTYYKKVLDLCKEIKHKRLMAMVLNNISVIHKKQGKFAEALDYAKQSLKIKEELGERSRTANTLALIALIYEEQDNHPAALQYLNKSLEIAKAINEREYIAGLSMYIGVIMRKTGQYSKALSWLEQAAAIAAEIKVLENERQAAKELAETYAAVNDYKKAFAYHKKYKELNDSIFNEKNSKKMAELQARYDFEKKEKEIQLLKKNEEIQQLKLKRQKNFTYSLIIISLLVLLIAILTYTRYRLKDRTNRALGKEIEDHKQTAQMLRESEEKFRTMAEKSVVGIYIIDDNGFKYVNPRGLEIFGYARDEMVGKNPLEFVLKEDRPLVLKNIRQRLDGDIEAVHYQFRGITSGGETIYLESYGARSLYQGQPAVIGTLIDITDRKKTEAELVRSQKMEAVAILAGGIAHDFNNLLSVVMGYLELIKKKVKNDKSTFKMVNSVERATKQAVELIDKFISFSKGGWMEPQKIHLGDILKITVDRHPEVEPLLGDVSFPAGLYPVYGDDRQLGEVVFNLLKNADEAMTEPKHVSIKAENITLDNENSFSLKEGDYLKISIIDKGRGISPEQLEKIFDPYFTTKYTFNEKGLGLGLAICYAVMKKHNGHIAVQSQVGVGTTVELYLPASNSCKIAAF